MKLGFVTTIMTLVIASTGNAKDRVQTPLSRVELMSALREGHQLAFGRQPNERRLAMAWAQVALENGQGKYTYNHNLGNLVSRAASTSTYWNGGDRYHPYMSFATFAEGAEAYWRVLSRCWIAVSRFDQGDPTGAAEALKRCRYYEAPVEDYAKGLNRLYSYGRDHVLTEERDERKQQDQRFIELIRATFERGTPARRAAFFPTDDDR